MGKALFDELSCTQTGLVMEYTLHIGITSCCSVFLCSVLNCCFDPSLFCCHRRNSGEHLALREMLGKKMKIDVQLYMMVFVITKIHVLKTGNK